MDGPALECLARVDAGAAELGLPRDAETDRVEVIAVVVVVVVAEEVRAVREDATGATTSSLAARAALVLTWDRKERAHSANELLFPEALGPPWLWF